MSEYKKNRCNFKQEFLTIWSNIVTRWVKKINDISFSYDGIKTRVLQIDKQHTWHICFLSFLLFHVLFPLPSNVQCRYFPSI